MARTKKRPLPSKRIQKTNAIAFAAASGIAGVSTLAMGANSTTALLGAGTIALYAGVYTPMKPLTPMNTWVGAVVGAIPPVMGWTAAGGALISPEACFMSSALFFWQIPHFLALAWMYRADYAAGGYKMVPLADPTGRHTSAICLRYSLYLATLPFGCYAYGLTSFMFPLESICFNGLMIGAALKFYMNHEQRGAPHARNLFYASLAYLPFFFGAFLLHQKTDKVPAEPSIHKPVGAANQLRDRILETGRLLCLHENHVPVLAPNGDASNCPMTVTQTKDSSSTEPGPP